MESMGGMLKQMLDRVEQLKRNSTGEKKQYRCNLCEDEEGWFAMLPFKDSPEPVEQWVRCSCKQQEIATRLMEASRISNEFFRTKTFANFSIRNRPKCVKEAHDTALEYVVSFATIRRQEQNSIALLGQPGSGKTHLLMAVANQLIDDGVAVVYFPWVEGWNDIRANLDKMDAKVRLLQHAEVLFIDDLFKGRNKPTDFVREQFFGIVNFRYLNNLPMLISGERDFDDLINSEFGDEAIGSRLYERCKGFAVTLGGNESLNYRMREKL